MYFNRAIVIGNLTRDPELRSLPSGVQVATIGVATNRVWKDKNGAKQESADFHNIVVFGRQAEIVAQYLRKGSSVLAEGRMQTRSWDGADGQKKYRTEIVADRIQFGPRSGGAGAPAAPKAAPQPEDVSGGEAIEYPEENINIDDIPF
jgi:single-strand DNA-binding protein